VEKALKWQRSRPSRTGRRRAIGTAAEVRAQLDEARDRYGADEIMLVNILPDHQARVRSYALVAEEYGLAEPALVP